MLILPNWVPHSVWCLYLWLHHRATFFAISAQFVRSFVPQIFSPPSYIYGIQWWKSKQASRPPFELLLEYYHHVRHRGCEAARPLPCFGLHHPKDKSFIFSLWSASTIFATRLFPKPFSSVTKLDLFLFIKAKKCSTRKTACNVRHTPSAR